MAPESPFTNLYSKTFFDDEGPTEDTSSPSIIDLGRVSMNIKGDLTINGKMMGNLSDKKSTLSRFYKYIAKRTLEAT